MVADDTLENSRASDTGGVELKVVKVEVDDLRELTEGLVTPVAFSVEQDNNPLHLGLLDVAATLEEAVTLDEEEGGLPDGNVL